MVELNQRARTIQVKIVYYGPPLGGKTTNLQVLHQHAQGGRRGELVSINSAQDRTILFDLLPLRAAGFRGFDLKFQLLAVPGQPMYAATRRLVLKGADAIVFVANSATDRWEENLQSFREMTQNLLAQQLDPASLPLILQYNKRDLPQVTAVEFLDRALNARKIQALPAVAVRGEGVLETFSAALVRTMQDLSSRYRIIDTGKGQTIAQWAQETIRGIFGTTSLALEPHPAETPPASSAPARPADPWGAERRLVRVALPDESRAGTSPDARANESLVETYAEASAQLTDALDRLREDRDGLRKRLEDLQHALTVGHNLMEGQPLDSTLRLVLAQMAEAAGTNYASFLLPQEASALNVAALRGISEDRLLRAPAGVRHLLGKVLQDAEPRLYQGADSLDLGDALESAEPLFGAVASVPFRTPAGLQGVALFYYTPDSVLPQKEALGHLSLIARAVSASLELAAALERVRTAERMPGTALSGTASVSGLEDILSALGELRDRLGGLRRHPEASPGLLEELARLAPSLAKALATVRSLLAFARGQIQPEPVAIEEISSDLRADGVRVRLGPGVIAVSGDPALLRLALRMLSEHIRSVAGRATPLELRATLQRDGVRVTLRADSLSSATLKDAARASEAALTTGEVVPVVRRIAEMHGTSLDFEKDEVGASFSMRLPAA